MAYVFPWGTIHTYLLEIRCTLNNADPCVFNLDSGTVLLLLHVHDILLSGSDDAQGLQVIEKLNDRFETVGLGDAKFLLGKGIHRNVYAGTIIFSQETYARTILQTYGMADAHPTKTPAEAGPVQIEEEEVLSTEDTTLFRSATGFLRARGRTLRMQLWCLREVCLDQVRER